MSHRDRANAAGEKNLRALDGGDLRGMKTIELLAKMDGPANLRALLRIGKAVANKYDDIRDFEGFLD